MALATMTLDPDAQAYVDLADLDPTADAALDAAVAKLVSIEDGATADLTASEIRDLIVALADAERLIVITRPVSGKHKCIAMQRNADGKLEVEYDDVPET